MIIEKGRACIQREYYTVRVCAQELMGTVNPLPYSAWVGTIDVNGTKVWYPASYRPRGYREAAQALLDRAYTGVYGKGRDWVDLVRGIGEPKVTWVQVHLDSLGVTAVREGYAPQGPIVRVPHEDLERAWEFLNGVARVVQGSIPSADPIADLPDDHPVFRPPYFERGSLLLQTKKTTGRKRIIATNKNHRV